jgi:hypothetical protein
MRIMFSKVDTSQPEPSNTQNQPTSSAPRHRRRLYAFAGIIAIIVIAMAIFVPPAFSASIELSLNYTVGEKMTYTTTNTVTNQNSNTSINIKSNSTSETINSTSSYEILSFNGANYTIKQTITSEIYGKPLSIPLTTNISKTKHYSTLLPAGAGMFFNNITGNPTLEAYLAKSQAKVGDTWQFPVSTGNSSLGMTGELTLKFLNIQEITVPAGTYQVFVIEMSSSNLIAHVSLDNEIISGIMLGNTNLQLNGKTYLEYGTCRLIKSELTQEATWQATGINGTTVIYSEKTLVEHTKP